MPSSFLPGLDVRDSLLGDTSTVDRKPPISVPLQWISWPLVAALVAPAVATTFADPDLWGHLRFGLDVLARGQLGLVDSYSFTQDRPWINHEWLSELMLGIAYRLGDTAGLVVLKTILVAVALTVIAEALKGAFPVVAGAVIVVVAWGTMQLDLTPRPQVWTFIGVCVLCRLLLLPPRRAWLLYVPLLFAVWVNLHGGWIVGAGVLAVWTVCHLRPEEPRRLIASVAVLSALATLINPYGWDMWRFLLQTVRPSRDITEWQPLSLFPLHVTLPYLLTGVTALFATVSRHRPGTDRLAIILLLGIGGVRVNRIAPLWVAATAVLLSPTLTAWSAAVPKQWWTFRVSTRPAVALLMIPGLCAVLAAGLEVRRAVRCIGIAGSWVPDPVAGATLSSAPLRGTMVTSFEWGEYVLWHLSPGVRVSIDGRRETIYTEEVLQKYGELFRQTPSGIAYLRTLNPTYVWMPAALTRLRDALVQDGYRLDLETKQSFVAVRRDAPLVRATGPAPGARCFPGP